MRHRCRDHPTNHRDACPPCDRRAVAAIRRDLAPLMSLLRGERQPPQLPATVARPTFAQQHFAALARRKRR